MKVGDKVICVKPFYNKNGELFTLDKSYEIKYILKTNRVNEFSVSLIPNNIPHIYTKTFSKYTFYKCFITIPELRRKKLKYLQHLQNEKRR